MVIENQIIDPEKRHINLIPLKKYITEINNNQVSDLLIESTKDFLSLTENVVSTFE
jgi:hypothetical protein